MAAASKIIDAGNAFYKAVSKGVHLDETDKLFNNIVKWVKNNASRFKKIKPDLDQVYKVSKGSKNMQGIYAVMKDIKTGKATEKVLRFTFNPKGEVIAGDFTKGLKNTFTKQAAKKGAEKTAETIATETAKEVAKPGGNKVLDWLRRNKKPITIGAGAGLGGLMTGALLSDDD